MSIRKNFSIQAFRQQPGVDQAAAQKLWNSLRTAIGEIYQQNASSLSFEELYRNAYNLILHKHFDLLYEGVRGTIRDHLALSLVEIASAADEDFLGATVGAWSFHVVAFNMMKDILMYMDRSYAQPRRKATTYTMALQLFREVILYDAAVCLRMRLILLQDILSERRGRVIDRGQIRSILGMLTDLGVDGVCVYEEQFEAVFLQETRSFYQVESLAFLSENTCHDYLIKAEVRLAEEAARALHYLAPSTEPKLRAAAEAELVTTHCKALLEMDSGFGCMLREDKIADLARLYTLLGRVPLCLEQLREHLGQTVRKSGMDIISAQEAARDPIGFVKALLELKCKYDTIIREACQNDSPVRKKLNEAFGSFINTGHHCAAHLAAYADELLRGGIQGASEIEVEEKLEQVLVIFKFLSDKDIFESYYKKLLCKRLLASRTVSDEVERGMIAKFKAECGYQFTTKLEGMFQDMNSSKAVQEEFRASPAYHAAGIEVQVHVLTTGYWPLQASLPCTLPPAVLTATDAFNSFYLGANSGKKLTWLSHLGSIDLKSQFPSGRKELSVSLYQAAILLLFNETEVLPLETIERASGVPAEELRRHLLSLCTPKMRVLKKSSKSKGIETGDVFTFNIDFSSKFKRMKVPLISAKEVRKVAGPAEEEVPGAVEEERRHHVEATLVRIMKSRKTLSHNELVAETTRQLAVRFTPSPQFIKRRVESLIEREYLQRDKDDARAYQYLA